MIFTKPLKVRSLISGTLILISLAMASCSDDDKETKNSKDDSEVETKKNSGDGDADKTQKHLETLTVDSVEPMSFSRPLHMIWVVDNSQEMQDDITAFTTAMNLISGALKSIAQIKITVITKFDDNWHIKAGDQKVNAQVLGQTDTHPVSYEVRAKEPLRVLANYLSDKATDQSSDFYFPLSPPLPGRIDSHPQTTTFFRDSESLKAFVVMTNTPAYGSSTKPKSSAFMALLKDIYSDDLSLFRFYAFINEGTDNTADTDNNAAFKALTQELGGETWNINGITTQMQWNGIFLTAQTQMLSEMQSSSTSEKIPFTLQHTISKVLEVKVNDIVLSSDSFHTAGKMIYISVDEIRSGDALKVSYESIKAS